MSLYQERRSPSPLTRSRDYLRPSRRSRNALRRSIIPSIASHGGGIGEGREVIWEGTHQSSQICLVLRRKFFIWLWVVQPPSDWHDRASDRPSEIDDLA